MTSALEGQSRFVGGSKVGGTTDQPGDLLSDDVQHLVVGVAAGSAFGVGWVFREFSVPALWQLAALHLVQVIGQLRILLAIRGEELIPLGPGRGNSHPPASRRTVWLP